MTSGPKSQLLAGIVVDTIPGPVSAVYVSFTKIYKMKRCNHA